jgi:Flp pilus assembly protein TadB
MNTWNTINKGVRRLIMLGYAICVLLAVQTWRGIRPDKEVQKEITQRAARDIQEHQEKWSDPFFAKSSNRYRKERARLAGEEQKQVLAAQQAKRRRAWGLVVGYPLVVVLGLWVLAGFKSESNSEL